MQEIEPRNGVSTVAYVLERLPAAGGERTKVVTDVLAFGLAPDGKRLAYARLAPQTGETLNAVDLDGTNDVVLVGIDQNLSPFNVPRYSPDGKKIAFASADQTGARAASPEYVSAAAFGSEPAPALDGLPEDIWNIDADGGRPVRVADLKEDLPALTWSGDGKHLYVLGSAGLYDVNVATGAVDRLGEGAFHGQLTWVP
jgi:Tol biopolymer transport system component